MKLMNNITRECQPLPKEMSSKRQVLFIQFTLWAGVKILRTSKFPYPFIYLNLGNPYAFIYLKPEKGTPLWQSLPV